MRDSRYALITTAPYPIGTVSTLRYSSYMEALARIGCFAEIIILFPTRSAKLNKEKNGLHNSVHFHYMSKISWDKRPNYIFQVYYVLIGLVNSTYRIIKDRITHLIIYQNDANLPMLLYYKLLTLCLGIKLINERNEYPYHYATLPEWKKKYEGTKLFFFDGFIAMTKELEHYCIKFKRKKARVFVLPATLPVSRFDSVEKKDVQNKYIALLFSIYNRDSVEDAVISYVKYINAIGKSGYRLVLIGDFERFSIRDQICAIINENNIDDMVEIKGAVPINDVPQLLINAECLLTTAKGYSSGGFPTKLVEYLLSGVPVVATSAGEIGNFLTNHSEALLATPGNTDEIANLLLYVHHNPVIASQIGQQGRMYALKYFNADNYAEQIVKTFKY